MSTSADWPGVRMLCLSRGRVQYRNLSTRLRMPSEPYVERAPRDPEKAARLIPVGGDLLVMVDHAKEGPRMAALTPFVDSLLYPGPGLTLRVRGTRRPRSNSDRRKGENTGIAGVCS